MSDERASQYSGQGESAEEQPPKRRRDQFTSVRRVPINVNNLSTAEAALLPDDPGALRYVIFLLIDLRKDLENERDLARRTTKAIADAAYAQGLVCNAQYPPPLSGRALRSHLRSAAHHQGELDSPFPPGLIDPAIIQENLLRGR